jgi:hypothetical protein
MPPPSTLSVGMEVHQESRAVASVANEDGAEVVALGSSGTRQCDLARRIRKLHAQSPHRVFVSEAGPAGMGSSAIGRNKGMSAGSWPPLCSRRRPGSRSTPTAATPSTWPAGGAQELCPRSMSPRSQPKPGVTCVAPVKRPGATSRRRRIGSQPFASGRLVARWAPSPEHGRPAGGPSPSRSACPPHSRTRRVSSTGHTVLPAIGSGAAPVWCHPRQRSEGQHPRPSSEAGP